MPLLENPCHEPFCRFIAMGLCRRDACRYTCGEDAACLGNDGAKWMQNPGISARVAEMQEACTRCTALALQAAHRFMYSSPEKNGEVCENIPVTLVYKRKTISRDACTETTVECKLARALSQFDRAATNPAFSPEFRPSGINDRVGMKLFSGKPCSLGFCRSGSRTSMYMKKTKKGVKTSPSLLETRVTSRRTERSEILDSGRTERSEIKPRAEVGGLTCSPSRGAWAATPWAEAGGLTCSPACASASLPAQRSFASSMPAAITRSRLLHSHATHTVSLSSHTLIATSTTQLLVLA